MVQVDHSNLFHLERLVDHSVPYLRSDPLVQWVLLDLVDPQDPLLPVDHQIQRGQFLLRHLCLLSDLVDLVVLLDPLSQTVL